MKIKIILLVLFVLLLIIEGTFFNKNSLLLNSNNCEIKKSIETPVSLELAKSTSIEYVHANNLPNLFY